MTVQKLAGTRDRGEPPRSTAYYYADLERFKRKEDPVFEERPKDQAEYRKDHAEPKDLTEFQRFRSDPIFENFPKDQELSEYVESNEVVKTEPTREIPPFRDRRQFSLPEYSTPENGRKIGETYSTAGTFPMPEPKEKEPLLAELEVVGRLPLTQLDSGGMRRSRSWYLCCPNVGEDELSRESSWRYSSLRPVTAPPVPSPRTVLMVATESSGREDVSALRAERDALARALAAERQRAASAARAHDARLAELHGVIAELVRRRAAGKHAGAIPEEELSDECESTTQPAGELDNDADQSRTEQNDTSSVLSESGLPTPQDAPVDLPLDTEALHISVEKPRSEQSSPLPSDAPEDSLQLSERDSEICVNTARCCQHSRGAASAGSCERQRGSPAQPLHTASPGRAESRQAKIASRVKLRRTDDSDSTHQVDNEESWCAKAAERLALDVCAQADLREAIVAAGNDGAECVYRARCLRLQADCRVLRAALARASDTAQRLYASCSAQESSCVSVCAALRAADRALEVYDVLLALAESERATAQERCAAELVARQLLGRLAAEGAAIGSPLVSPGPWLQHRAARADACGGAWTADDERALREHAARLKGETVSLRGPPPALFTYHDIDEEEIPKSGPFSMAEMEEAVALQDQLTAREARAIAARRKHSHKSECRPRRRARHWLDAAETDL